MGHTSRHQLFVLQKILNVRTLSATSTNMSAHDGGENMTWKQEQEATELVSSVSQYFFTQYIVSNVYWGRWGINWSDIGKTVNIGYGRVSTSIM